MQMVTLEPSDPVVWPEGTGALHLAQGSVNMIDCQDGVLDLRNRNLNLTLEHATMSFYRCNVVFPDMFKPWTDLTYWYDATGIFPCNVRFSPIFLRYACDHML